MVSPVGHRTFMSLARCFRGTDAELAVLLGTSASTISRLRAGKTQKMDAYIKRLEAVVGTDPMRMENIVADLQDWSAQSEVVHDLVVALHRLAKGSVDI